MSGNTYVTEEQYYLNRFGVDYDLISEWKGKQAQLKSKIIEEDTEAWQSLKNYHKQEEIAAEGTDNEVLKYVAGADIAYCKEDATLAVVAVVICRLPDMQVVHRVINQVKVTTPYVPGFLAFREADFVVKEIRKIEQERHQLFVQAILVDGNGLLHPRECGLACHIGVTLDRPCIGVAKNLLHVEGIARDEEHKNQILKMSKKGDWFPLVTNTNRVLGAAVRTSDSCTKPVYISMGHRFSLETAVWLTLLGSKYRIPEPTRQADIMCNEFMRQLNGEASPNKEDSK